VNLLLAATPGCCVQRLVNKPDFERLLATRSRSRSTHFSVHHVAAAPWTRIWLPKKPGQGKLSTDTARTCPQAVDESLAAGPNGTVDGATGAAPNGWWLGCVVPKRHARRAVTRSLLKRQVRGAFQRHMQNLPAGMWLVRLRAPFGSDKSGKNKSGSHKPANSKAGNNNPRVAEFVSAASSVLALAARRELDALLGGVGA
jgi:ribonuclease P protein component